MRQHYFFSNHLENSSLEKTWKSILKEVQWIYLPIDMLSHRCSLSTLRFFISRFISSSVKVFFSNLLFILNSKEGNWLLLITGVHWETKYELKSSALLATFETSLSSTRIGGVLGIFLLLKNPFEINQ